MYLSVNEWVYMCLCSPEEDIGYSETGFKGINELYGMNGGIQTLSSPSFCLCF